MTAAQKEVMRNTLDNLTGADFKRFRRYLQDQGQIPWGKLEKADTDDTVDVMVKVYNTEAGGVMLDILKKMNHNQLAMTLARDLARATNSGDSHGQTGSKNGQEFFKKHMGQLELRLGVLAPLLIDLQCCAALSSVEREEVESQPTSQKKNHALLVMLERKGAIAQEKFYEALKRNDPLLVKHLED